MLELWLRLWCGRRVAGAGAQLQRGIAVLLVGAVREHLDILHLQHGHRHMRTFILLMTKSGKSCWPSMVGCLKR